MLLTQECDYGFRLLRNLNYKEAVSMAVIVDKEKMTIEEGHKVARKLEVAGIIKSIRGHRGGYLLAKNLKELTFLELCRAIEPGIIVAKCLRDDFECLFKDKDAPCTIRNEFSKLQEIIFDYMGSRSVADVIEGR